jgi:kumamolisin
MGLIRRSRRAAVIGFAGMAITGLSGAFTASAAMAAAPSASPSYTSLRDSVPATVNARTGQFSSSRMSVEVVLAPQHQAQLNGLLASVYTPGTASYQHWLAKGQFNARFAPAVATRTAVAQYLRSRGLEVRATASPFLVRATGSSQQMAVAFRTTLSTYQDRHGAGYFANSAAVQLPSTMAAGVLGVIGLTNTVRPHSMVALAKGTMRPASKPAASSAAASASCETGYPTRKQLFNLINNGVGFPSGYGGGPACTGLTPSQTNSIYGAPHVGPRGKGAGVTLGLFELSAYQKSDIATYAHTFFGPGFTPHLANVNVDGGPLNPVCPAGDTCPPEFNGYAGDIEVDADIETQLAVAPDVSRIVVYNAPNDETGQTSLDEYTRIANDNVASSVSSSWGVCENDVTAAYTQAENVLFEQMALQGQSMFTSSGDSGAFGCIDTDGSTIVNIGDPTGQPWVTSVGGTSLESFNPGTKAHLQRQPARARVVRDRRHQPVVAAVVGDHRGPGQLPRSPQREHQPAAVPAAQDQSETVLPRRHRDRPEAEGRDHQRPVPDHAGI